MSAATTRVSLHRRKCLAKCGRSTLNLKGVCGNCLREKTPEELAVAQPAPVPRRFIEASALDRHYHIWYRSTISQSERQYHG